MIRSTGTSTLWIATIVLWLVAPALASAGPIITINDSEQGFTASLASAASDLVGSLSIVTQKEAVGVLGSAVITFDYRREKIDNEFSAGFTRLYNISESSDAGSLIGDTLSIVVTELNHGNNVNTRVAITFFSDSSNGVLPTELTNGQSLVETASLQTVSDTLLTKAGLTVQFSSNPEPATFTLLGIGIAGMAGYGWRKKKATAPVH